MGFPARVFNVVLRWIRRICYDLFIFLSFCVCSHVVLSCWVHNGNSDLFESKFLVLFMFSSLVVIIYCIYRYKQRNKYSEARFHESSFQIIDDNRNLDVVGLDNLLERAELIKCEGDSYNVVSIIGPQSSGKSTLINHLFGTCFAEMDASNGRSQTTKGIWMANCVGIRPRTIVMDVEGCDGQERGEDDMLFEKQLALFSLVSSNIVMLNIFYTSIGLNSGASKPLLRIVFQEMMKMSNPKKVTLILVIRDRDRQMPFGLLESDLKNDIEKMWESITESSSQKAQLNDFFQVKVVALASYGLEKKQFKIDVAKLRNKFFNSTLSRGLAEDPKTVIAASGYSAYVQNLWNTIKDNRDLDIPSHRLLVAMAQCEKFAKEMLTWFSEHEEWINIQKSVDCGLMEGFGNKVGSLLDTCLIRFDERATFYDEKVRKEKRIDLETTLLQHIKPTWELLSSHIVSRALETFKEEFDKAAVLIGMEDLERASSDCIQSANTQFDTRCADAAIPQAKWDTCKLKEALQPHFADYVTAIVTQKRNTLKALEEKAEAEAKYKAAVRENQVAAENVTKNAWGIARTTVEAGVCVAMPVVGSLTVGIIRFTEWCFS